MKTSTGFFLGNIAFFASFNATNGFRLKRKNNNNINNPISANEDSSSSHHKHERTGRHEKNNADIASLTPEDFEVSRSLLQEEYPVFESFHGSMHAGLLPAAFVDKHDNHGNFSSYFFWLFQPDHSSENSVDDNGSGAQGDNVENFRDDTLIIWLNGGPGCSSMIGNLVENGPITLPLFRAGIRPGENPASSMGATFTENIYSWTQKSAMLFVEQPGGVGFSTASKEWMGEDAEYRTEDDVSNNFFAFLQNLYRVFGEELRGKRLYLAGESYAGMYIPSIARGIHLGNQKVIAAKANDVNEKESKDGLAVHNPLIINLVGVAIGNGWIDAFIQGPTVIDYAFWHGMIDLRTFQSLHEKWDECISAKILDESESPFHPFTTPDECGITTAVMEASGSSNMYDVTTYDTYPVHVDPEGAIHKFFNDPNTRAALNVPSIEELPMWQACVPGSGRRRRRLSEHSSRVEHQQGFSSRASSRRELILLANDRPSVVPYIAELLDDANIHVLLYNGDLDLACSSQSTEMALDSMGWSGNLQWMDPDTTKWMEWVVDGQVAGHSKRYNNLEFVVVYNSGHFVPTNQGRNSLNLIGRLLDGKSFGDEELPQFPSRGAGFQNHLVTPPAKTISNETKSFSAHIRTVLSSFLLGALVSALVTYHFVMRKNSRKFVSESFYLDSDSPKTEFTPLKHESGSPGN